MFRIANVTLLLLGGSAAAAELPRFNIEAICRAAPRLEASDPNPYPGCVRDETEARTQLEQQWGSFNIRQREMCVQETNVGGFPSYVDVLTCMQMASGNPPTAPARRPRHSP